MLLVRYNILGYILYIEQLLAPVIFYVLNQLKAAAIYDMTPFKQWLKLTRSSIRPFVR